MITKKITIFPFSHILSTTKKIQIELNSTNDYLSTVDYELQQITV